jgi:diaminopimelate decarboxylase
VTDLPIPGEPAAPDGVDARAEEIDRLPEIAGALRLAAARHGTPLYLVDVPTLALVERRMRAAFPDPWVRQYSLKANDVAAVVQRLAGLGWGANVVSRGEWAIASKAGVPNARITLEGIGKTDHDLRGVVRAARAGQPLRWTALESADEATALASLAARAGTTSGNAPLDVLFRLNPDVVPETHRGLQVGGGSAKFGLTESELSRVVESAAATGWVRPRGIHLHVGSQLGAVDAWRDAVRKALALLALIRGSLPDFDTLDVGGGMPVAPVGVPAPGPERFAREVPALLDAIPADRRPRTMAIEPGRALVARAGWLVARVLHVRDRSGRQVIVDAGMTELIRPALYGAVHPIVALTSLGRPWIAGAADGATETSRVEGPICESTDELGEHRLPALQRGDLVAIRDAGAYAASQGSAYNGRPRPPQVLLEADGRLVLERRRGTVASLG